MGTTKTDWDLSILLDNNSESEIESSTEEMILAVKKFRERWIENQNYTKDPLELEKALTEYEILIDSYFPFRPHYYSFLKLNLNQSDENAKKLDAKLTEKTNEAQNLIQFFEINLSKIPNEFQKIHLSANNLKGFRHFLFKLFESGKHTLTDAEERIMNLKSSVSHERWENLTSELLAKEKRQVLQEDGTTKYCNYNEISNFFLSTKKEVRDSAFEAFKSILNAMRDVSTAEFNAILENKKINDLIRNYADPEEARYISDDIDRNIVNTLVNIVSKNYNLVARYYTLKAKLLKQEKLDYQDRNAEIGDINFNLSFEESFDLVKNVFSSVDNEYGELLQKFLDNGIIDVFPKEGKASGAFCIRGSKKIPPFILLNFDKRIDSIQTLAHEAGHAINHHLLNNINSGLNRSSSTAIAEVASTFFETLVLDHIAENLNDEKEKLILLMTRINDQINTVFRQISFFETERDFHNNFRQKFNLSAEELDEIYITNSKKYTVNSIANINDINSFWVAIPHFRYFFYVYSYSSGIIISNALRKMMKEDSNYKEKLRVFLSSGSSKSPSEIFLELGINLNNSAFWENGIQEIVTLISQAEILAEKLNYEI